ncbi:TRAP transporter small permease [Nocardioides houyundeii]|uniref:TRAP transporter small permease n=1 Tax=Nocardioides houyundeii TaxID=2045452 RepID=UPI000C778458|nr:TRAP transporter small permease [Nocardioides houyundeii]
MSVNAEAEINALEDPPPTGDWFSRILAGAAAFVTIAMMLHVTVNALSRTFRSSPVHGTLEYTQFWYLPIVAFVGIVTAQRNKEHIEARLLFDHIPARAQPFVQAGTDLLTLALAVALTYYTAEMALDSMDLGRTAGVSGITIWPATFAAPVGFALFSVWLTVDLFRSVRAGLSKPSSSGTTPEES